MMQLFFPHVRFILLLLFVEFMHAEKTLESCVCACVCLLNGCVADIQLLLLIERKHALMKSFFITSFDLSIDLHT